MVSALIGAAVGGGLAAALTSRSPQTVVREYFPARPLKVTNGDVQAVLARVLPAVVSIDTSSYQAGLLWATTSKGPGRG